LGATSIAWVQKYEKFLAMAFKQIKRDKLSNANKVEEIARKTKPANSIAPQTLKEI
jgi:hypothetical protein